MPIQTDLSVSPYFDDYSNIKDYYKILFKPGVAVQVRELNQLQTLLQAQIEKFGDSVYKRGTIIDGCNFTFLDKIKYARIKDIELDGTPVNVSTYKNLFAKDSDGLTASILETESGFESQAPDLNTLYLRYVNGGTTYNRNKFDKNTIITIYDKTFPITKALVNEGSSGFSNADSVIIYPAIAIQNTTGGATFAANTWVINTKIVQDTTGAEAEILEVNTTALSTSLVLKIRPLETDLDDTVPLANNWTFEGGYTITGATLGAVTANSSANASVISVIGEGAVGTLVTDSTGKIITVAVTAGGSGYSVPPHVTFTSTTGAIESANVEAYNYTAKVTIQNDDAGIGNSYGMAIGDGVIYQKGYFSRVSNQLKIVEKYSTDFTPDEKVVGFDTLEDIIDSNGDQDLLDNSLGTYNYTAPGSDRVKLTPTLVVLSKADADANTEFLPLVEFSQGRPFKQTRGAQFNKVAIELAKRTYDESGNYVIDSFRSISTSPATNEANTFSLVIDPGVAYIKGNRVESVLDYTETIDKGIDVTSITSTSVDLTYGNYIKVTSLGGYFQFNTGDVISLRDTVANYTANTDLVGTQPAAFGTEIGKARIRSLVYESGEPGSSAIYRLYVFDVVMNAGKGLGEVLSVFYDGTTYKGYADTVLENSLTVIKETDKNFLVFPTGYTAVKNVSTVSYSYRSVNATATANVSGVVNASLATGSWKYIGNLSSAEKAEIIVVPLGDLETANVGTASVGAGVSTNTTVVLSNTTFGAALNIGDYIKVYGASSNNKIRRVVGITNSSVITINQSIGLTNTTSNVSFICPKYVPIQLNTRTDRVANVTGNFIRVYINPPANFTSGNTVSVSYNADRGAISATSKNTFRNRLVKIQIANNVAGNTGPWNLGVPDIFRLKAVYTHTSTTVNTASTDITNEFFIDHNQTENIYDTGYLFKKPGSTLTLSSSDFLLVKYDAFNRNEGVYTVTSYQRSDASNLSALDASSANVHTVEIPAMYTSRGGYVDLRDVIDFRVTANTTANTSVTSATDANITINPGIAVYADKIDDTTEKYFPIPESDLLFGVDKYEGRYDRVVVNANGNFITIRGTPGSTRPPNSPDDALTINILKIPPYPSIPRSLSANTIQLLDSSIANIKYTKQREARYSIQEDANDENIEYFQPPAYKMTDIASIDRRLRNVESRIDLKEVEDQIKDQGIPSSVDGTDRFKFGFFVDDFLDQQYSELNDPEYAATNFDGRITAIKTQTNIKNVVYAANGENFQVGNMITLPFVEHSIAKQLTATTRSTTATANTQTTGIFEERTFNGSGKDQDKAGDNSVGYINSKNIKLTLSATGGPVTFFFFQQTRDRFEIHQSTDPNFKIADNAAEAITIPTLVTTQVNAQNITKADHDRLKSSGGITAQYIPAWRSGELTFRAGYQGPGLGIGARGQVKSGRFGKITWTHDPSEGQYYIIRRFHYRKRSQRAGIRIEYPIDSVSQIAVATIVTNPADFSKTNYVGSLLEISPKVLLTDIIVTKKKNTKKKKITTTTVTYETDGNDGPTPIEQTVLKEVYKSLGEEVSNRAGLYEKETTTVSYETVNGKKKFKSAVDASKGPTKVSIKAAGLRPSTLHDIYFSGALVNSKSLPLDGPGSLGVFGADTVGGSTIISDAEGKIDIEFYYDNGIPDSLTETQYTQLKAAEKSLEGNKTVTIVSTDGLSKLEFIIPVDIKIG